MPDNTFKIFKYSISGEKHQTLELPCAARVLEVDFQPNTEGLDLCLWALVMPTQTIVERRLCLIETGDEVPAEIVEKFDFVKTIQTVATRVGDDGLLVPKSIISHLFLERSVVN